MTITKTWGTSPTPPWEKVKREYLHIHSTFCDWLPDHVETVSAEGSPAENRISVRYELHLKRTALGKLAEGSQARVLQVYPNEVEGAGQALFSRDGSGPWSMQLN
jgi:hypothetical protein